MKQTETDIGPVWFVLIALFVSLVLWLLCGWRVVAII